MQVETVLIDWFQSNAIVGPEADSGYTQELISNWPTWLQCTGASLQSARCQT